MAIASAAILAVGAQYAAAVPTMRLSAGATVITIADGGALDSNAAVGAVTYIGAVGPIWTINVDTGLSKPLLGSASYPHMDINYSILSVGGGVMTIEWSDDNFNLPGAHGYDADIGGTGSGNPGTVAQYDTYIDLTNTLFGTPVQMTALGPFGPGAFSGATSGPGVGDNAFSLTEIVTVTHRVAGSSSGNAELTVPDGGTTVALLGLSLLGLFGAQRKLGRG